MGCPCSSSTASARPAPRRRSACAARRAALTKRGANGNPGSRRSGPRVSPVASTALFTSRGRRVWWTRGRERGALRRGGRRRWPGGRHPGLRVGVPGVTVTVVDAGHPGRATAAGPGCVRRSTIAEATPSLWPFLGQAGRHYPVLLAAPGRRRGGRVEVRATADAESSRRPARPRGRVVRALRPVGARRVAGPGGRDYPRGGRLLFPPLGPVHRRSMRQRRPASTAGAWRPRSGRPRRARGVAFVEVRCTGRAGAPGARPVDASRSRARPRWPARPSRWPAAPGPPPSGSGWRSASPSVPPRGRSSTSASRGRDGQVADRATPLDPLPRAVARRPGGLRRHLRDRRGFPRQRHRRRDPRAPARVPTGGAGARGRQLPRDPVGLRPTSADEAWSGRVPGRGNACVVTGHGANGLFQGPYPGRVRPRNDGTPCRPTRPRCRDFDPARFAGTHRHHRSRPGPERRWPCCTGPCARAARTRRRRSRSWGGPRRQGVLLARPRRRGDDGRVSGAAERPLPLPPPRPSSRPSVRAAPPDRPLRRLRLPRGAWCRPGPKGPAEVHCFWTDRYVVTVHRGAAGHRRRAHGSSTTRSASSRRPSSSRLPRRQHARRQLLPVLSAFDDKIDALEDAILREPTETQLGTLFTMKRQLIALRKVVAPERDMMSPSRGLADLPGMTDEAGRTSATSTTKCSARRPCRQVPRPVLERMDTHLSTVPTGSTRS